MLSIQSMLFWRSKPTTIDITAMAVKISIGNGMSSSTMTEADSAIVRPIKLHMPKAVPQRRTGKRNGVDT